MSVTKPNFFIIGAPKCGTTSMAEWLAEHPDIFMSPDKEPHFFSNDYVPTRRRKLFNYESLFRSAGDRFAVVGEASTGYFFSEVAVGNILEYSPAARFLVMLRNPIDMVVSLHAQRVSELYEDVTDLTAAWKLQGERLRGSAVPRYCVDPKLLQYGYICSLGLHLERLYELVPRERVLVVFLDDVRENPRDEYRKVLDFLGVEDDGREIFPVYNRAKISRWPALLKFMKYLTYLQNRWPVPRFRTGLLATAKAYTEREQPVSPLSEQMRNELIDYFQDDIKQLAGLTHRDLSEWMARRG